MHTYDDVILFLNILFFSNKRILDFIREDKLLNFIDLKLWQVNKLDFLLDEEKEKLIRKLDSIDLSYYKSRMDFFNIRYTTILNKNYPRNLSEIYNPPAILFFRGDLEKLTRSLAVVGARKASDYGLWATKKIIKELSSYDISIVSGMAIGIDRKAHESALDFGMDSIGVLASSIDIQYPKSNMDLYSRMNDSLLLAENALGVAPLPRNFVSRNRIISGISLGVLVIEANFKSGSLITANYGIEQGREVFAIPGGIDSLLSEGTNDLIKKGAKLVTCGAEIIEEFPYICELHSISQAKIPENMSEIDILVFQTISKKHLTFNQIQERTKLKSNDLYSALISLEMKGLIERGKDGHYTLNYI